MDAPKAPITCLVTRWIHENLPELDIRTISYYDEFDDPNNLFGGQLHNIIVFDTSLTSLHKQDCVYSVGIVVFKDGTLGIEDDYWRYKSTRIGKYPFKHRLNLADPDCFDQLKEIIDSYPK